MKRLQRRGRKGAAAVLLLLSAGLLGGCQAKEIQAPQLEEPVSISVDTIEVKREDNDIKININIHGARSSFSGYELRYYLF